jgi:hypothetical protein
VTIYLTTISIAAACSSVQQRAAACSSVQQRAAACSSVKQRAAACSSVQQRAAACSSVKQRAEACSSVQQRAASLAAYYENNLLGRKEDDNRPRANILFCLYYYIKYVHCGGVKVHVILRLEKLMHCYLSFKL